MFKGIKKKFNRKVETLCLPTGEQARVTALNLTGFQNLSGYYKRDKSLYPCRTVSVPRCSVARF